MVYKTPGVYVGEVSMFPSSVAEVETAIPAFIGYTEKAIRKGKSLTNKPTRISSISEFAAYFGGEYEIARDSHTSSMQSQSVIIYLDENDLYFIKSVQPSKRFYMYQALRQFFDNGGSACYVVSVGDFTMDVTFGNDKVKPTEPGLSVGLKRLKKYDEPTIILIPDAVELKSKRLFHRLQKRAMSQCAKLKDRVAVLDLQESSYDNPQNAVEAFRDGIGNKNLEYGIAYTPWLYTTYEHRINLKIFQESVFIGSTKTALSALTNDSFLNNLVVAAQTALADHDHFNSMISRQSASHSSSKARYAAFCKELMICSGDKVGTKFTEIIDYIRGIALDICQLESVFSNDEITTSLQTYANKGFVDVLCDLIAIEKNEDVLSITQRNETEVNKLYNSVDKTGWLKTFASTKADSVLDIEAFNADYGRYAAQSANFSENKDTALNVLYGKAIALPGAMGNDDVVSLDSIFNQIDGLLLDLTKVINNLVVKAQNELYERHEIIRNIVEHIKKELTKVPPSGSVVGRYAFIDSTRGVWKAPANIDIGNINGLTRNIDSNEQRSLNTDIVEGKSINAIRAFPGRGNLIWGARTLAGNDNEWRYVPVRRFFNMVLESVTNSTTWAVFEPNDEQIWTAVKSVINNYLTQKWRQGALAGAKPEHAFFVKVGLGETMTAQDVIANRMNIEIGMALVRPAEFNIMRFTHNMQSS